MGTDVPGRTFSGASGRRSALDQGDPHLEEERTFLRTVADDLAQRVERGEIRRLILVAPPRALGLLRELENAHLKRVTVAELPHDYVKLPLYEIEERLKSQH
jgi:protein required for attachment to host cells